ncbi:hypothetical protein [Gimesia aquarii]|uniref:Uncharacterized protein n=1 Tax=Gimesia aquarii TaxID=2527964 RepID=A0A517W141_9PLAN|nr:hypothetical protein [Gimesia aquarii]QDT98972.1 hypothetical protein V144x_44820 [Gimesia aquarii]
MALKTLTASTEITQYVLTHMMKRLNETEPYEEPFPYIAVTNIFPDDIYAELIENLPEQSNYTTMGERHIMENGESNRFEFELASERINQGFNEQQQQLWLGIRNALASSELKQAVFNCLSSGIAYRFGIDRSEVNQIEAFPRLSLMREKPGYFITPHPDTRKKIVTFQIALPRDRSQLELGTALYRRNLVPQHVLGKPKGFRGFEKVKQNPFEPNSAFAFSVINTLRKKSWHGREQLEGDSGIRNSLLNIYYAKQEHVIPKQTIPKCDPEIASQIRNALDEAEKQQ